MMCGTICIQDAEIHAFAEVVSMFTWPAQQAAVQMNLAKSVAEQAKDVTTGGGGGGGGGFDILSAVTGLMLWAAFLGEC